MTSWVVETLGPDAVMVRFGEVITPALVPIIRAATDLLRETLGEGVRDLVPSYTTLMVSFDPLAHSVNEMTGRVNALLQTLDEQQLGDAGEQIEIPVWYDPVVGPDLKRVARYHQLSVDEVIARHCVVDYHVFAIGFAPGFAYLGETPEALATPRLDTPRAKVPVGSVALADRQTAVYPIATPGGWNLIGRTPMTMFDRSRPQLCPVATGDRVRFVPISRAEFLARGGRFEQGDVV